MKIAIDVNSKTVLTDYSWQFGIGNDHAFQLLRKDVLEHLKLAHDESGFKYVRFHGIFCDDMQIIQSFADIKSFAVLPDAANIKELSFKQVAVVLDSILEIGLKPFVELSFMPKALASDEKYGLAYNNNTTMPKDLNKWAEFIKKFIEFLLDRYGKAEVESWYFEVWNEPDLPIFFSGTMEDYFALYTATVKAIKDVDGELLVGGPSTSGCKYLKEFTDYCNANNVPYDFISTHHYPGDAFGNILEDKDPHAMLKTAKYCAENGVDMGDAMTAMFYDPALYKTWEKGAFIELDRVAKRIAGDKPLFITEWNSMAVYAAPVHDEKYSAAFVVKSVMDAQGLTDGFMFWCCSDVFEEMYNLGKPFHGSFGIVSNDGIPKPNFWAFKILSTLYPERLDLPVTNDSVEYSVFKKDGKLQILVYAQDFDPDKNEKTEVTLTVNKKFSSVTVKAIDDNHCNPKGEWQKLGKPDLLSKAQVQNMKEKTRLACEKQPFTYIDGNTELKFVIKTNDVLLFELE